MPVKLSKQQKRNPNSRKSQITVVPNQRSLEVRKQFYARVSFTDENSSIIDLRIPLKAKSVTAARIEYPLVKSNLIQSTTDHDIPSFSDFAPKYLHEIDGLKRPKTVELEELHLKHLNEFLGKIKPDKISKQHVVRFRTAKIKGGWTGRTANLSINLLNSSWIPWAEEP